MADGKPRSVDLDVARSREVLDYVARNGEASVRELYDALHGTDNSMTEAELASLLWQLSHEGKISLEDVKRTSRSFTKLLARWEINLGLYSSLGVALGAIISIYVVSSDLPWVVFRWFFVSIFLLFTPGYVSSKILFPRATDFDSIERFMLSVGLSVVILMIVGLLLNFTSWGISLTPIVVSLSILDAALVTIAFVVEYISKG